MMSELPSKNLIISRAKPRLFHDNSLLLYTRLLLLPRYCKVAQPSTYYWRKALMDIWWICVRQNCQKPHLLWAKPLLFHDNCLLLLISRLLSFVAKHILKKSSDGHLMNMRATKLPITSSYFGQIHACFTMLLLYSSLLLISRDCNVSQPNTYWRKVLMDIWWTCARQNRQ